MLRIGKVQEVTKNELKIQYEGDGNLYIHSSNFQKPQKGDYFVVESTHFLGKVVKTTRISTN